VTPFPRDEDSPEIKAAGRNNQGGTPRRPCEKPRYETANVTVNITCISCVPGSIGTSADKASAAP
jgi:hypothetical protein